MFIPLSLLMQQGREGHLCTSNIVPIPTSKSEVQQISVSTTRSALLRKWRPALVCDLVGNGGFMGPTEEFLGAVCVVAGQMAPPLCPHPDPVLD